MNKKDNQEILKIDEINFNNSEYLSEISLEEANTIIGGLKCKNIPNSRFQVCGNTNFKNKVVVGVGIRF
jgi:hypothetical protein